MSVKHIMYSESSYFPDAKHNGAREIGQQNNDTYLCEVDIMFDYF